MSAQPGPALADLDGGTITRTVRVAAPRHVVWAALITPEHVVEWWGHPMRFPDGIRPGSVGIFEWEGGDFAVRIDRMDEPTHYGLTWGFDDDLGEETATQVLFELTEDGDGTLVSVTETGFDRRADIAARRTAMDQNTDGWNQVLDALAAYAAQLS